jgi:hypothetical protein
MPSTTELPAETDERLALLLERAGRAGSRRSPLYVWMWDHRDVLIPWFRSHQPNWDGVLAATHELGLLDRRGQMPTKQTLQQTWRRLLAAAEREKKLPAPQATPTAPDGPVVAILSQDGSRPADPPRLIIEMRPATLRLFAADADAEPRTSDFDGESIRQRRPSEPIA